MNRLLTVFILSLSTAAFAGSEVGNGGGLSEKNIRFAYTNLHLYLEICLQSSACRISNEEKKVLKNIADSLPAETKQELIFQSEKKSPGSFKIDGQVRVAKTGDHVGDPIYINSDLIYFEVAKDEFQATDVPLAVSILVHELGHHQGIHDHGWLDSLGTKLQVLLLAQISRSEFWNGNAAVYSLELNAVRTDDDKKKIKKIDQLILEQNNVYNLTERIADAVHCPDKNDTPKAIRFYNLHGKRGIAFDSKTRLLKKPFEAWYILSCKLGEETDHGDLGFTLVFRKLGNGEHFDFQPELTTVSQTSCLKDPSVCK